MFGRALSSFCLVALFFYSTNIFAASLSFVEQTRLIFNAPALSVSFPIHNNTNQKYLVKSSILNVENNLPADPNNKFLVLPEITVLTPGKKHLLQVTKITGDFPTDRESVFFLNGYFVPESKIEAKDDSFLNLAFSVNVKMFYRPLSIVDDNAIEKASERLIFEPINGTKVNVKNPTPYYLTFGKLVVNGVELVSGELRKMLKPYGSEIYKIEFPIKKATEVSWTLIDEYGNWTKELTVKRSN